MTTIDEERERVKKKVEEHCAEIRTTIKLTEERIKEIKKEFTMLRQVRKTLRSEHDFLWYWHISKVEPCKYYTKLKMQVLDSQE